MFTFWPISDIVINKLESRSSLTRLRTTDLDEEVFVLVIIAILYSSLAKTALYFRCGILHLEVLYLTKRMLRAAKKGAESKTKALQHEN